MALSQRSTGLAVGFLMLIALTAGCNGSDGAGGAAVSGVGSTSGAVSAGPSPAVSDLSSAAAQGAPVDGPVEIGNGRQIYLHCTGSGTPTVILESGYHDSSSLWSEDEPTPPAVGPSVQERLSEHVRVCSYDRPGTIVYGSELSLTDRSTPVDNPRLPSAAVADLHALIGAAELPTPVVIVAHSMGGLLARLYTQTHPEEVAGLVFVDAFAVEMPELMADQWTAYEGVLATPGTDFDSDPAFEVFDVSAGIAEITAAPPLPDIPMLVLSKTEPFPLPDSSANLGPALDRAWPMSQESLAGLGTNTPHVIATGSDHYIQVRQPDLVAESALVVIGRIDGTG